MPSIEYQIDKMEKILMTLRRSNRILGGIKKNASPRQLNKLMVDCTTAVNATNEVIDHIEALKAQLLEDMNMLEVPVQVEETEKSKYPSYLRRVK